MNPQFPRRRHALLTLLLTFALLLSPIAGARAQQQRQPSQLPSGDSLLSSIMRLGSSVLDSASGVAQGDPYWQFRNAKYSNAGLPSEEEEVKLGNRLHAEIGKRFKLTNRGQARANRIGQRVARQSRRTNITYYFYAVDDKEINAFASPGGRVYVTTGLLDIANDDELAAVLAHEVGHIVARHSLKTLQNAQMLGGIADLVGSVTGIAGDTAAELGTLAARIVASGLLSAHSREEEREADFLGVRAMPKAGFDAEGNVTMFQQIQKISKTRDASLLGAIFNDHPDVDERIANTRYEINRMKSETRGR